MAISEIREIIEPILILAAFVGGIATIATGLAKVGKLIAIGQRIIEEMAALRTDVAQLQHSDVAHRTAIAWLLGQAGQPMEAVDEIIEKATPPYKETDEHK